MGTTNIKHKLSGVIALIGVLLLAQSAVADLITLYDGIGLPASQRWLTQIAVGGTVTQSAVAGGVQLQTDLPAQSGYSNYELLATLKNTSFPSLNRSNGFELAFTLRVNSENHTTDHRAGFSALILGSDRRGIELGFWSNEIWAQSSSPLFQHAEGTSINTTVQRNYRLQVLNDSYTLLDGANVLLTGAVRDYTAFNGTPLGIPYTLSNYVFLGDNTTSGSADVVLGQVSLQSNLSSVPEPSSLAFGAFSLALLGLSRALSRVFVRLDNVIQRSFVAWKWITIAIPNSLLRSSPHLPTIPLNQGVQRYLRDEQCMPLAIRSPKL